MDELFGLPTIDLMWGVLAFVAVVAAIVGVIALRQPILVKMGLRNIPRRRAQTVLVTMGLTLATIIVTIAFSTGDSLATSIRMLELNALERIDHLIDSEDDVVPQVVVDDLRSLFADDDRVAGVFGARWEAVPAEHEAAGQVEPQFLLTGVESAVVDRLEGVVDVDGRPIVLGSLGSDEIVINERALTELAADVGDTVRLFVQGSLREFRVAAIGRQAVLTGSLETPTAGGVLPIEVFESLLGPELATPGEWNAVAVSGSGGVEGALASSDAVDTVIRGELTRLEEVNPEIYRPDGISRFSTRAIKADEITEAELLASAFTTLFLFMGSFSVVAGILLIFLIFAMLAEERKSEMGMARAVGMQRNDLIRMFMTEGIVYNCGATLFGVLLGLLFALGMIAALNAGFEQLGFHFTWTVTLKSLVISGGIGVVITFVTVVFSSFRASRLNIVAAIREIPESSYEEPSPLTLGRMLRNVLGVFTTAIGLGLLVTTPVTLILGAPVALALNMTGNRSARRLVPWVLLFGWRVLQWNPQWWVLFVIGGLYVLDLGLGEESFFLYMAGVSLVPLGVMMGLNKLRVSGWRVPPRLLYTASAAFVTFLWFAPNEWHKHFWNRNLDGGPELFVLAGAMLTATGTLLLVFNLDLIVGGIRRAVGGIGSMAPVIRIAAAYPAAARYRTGMTIAMIALITFALVNFTTINASFTRAFSSEDSLGGFEVLAFNTDVNQVADVREALEAVDADEVLEGIEHVGLVRVGSNAGTRAVTVLTERWDTLGDAPQLRGGTLQVVETDPSRVQVHDRDGVMVGGVNSEFIDGQDLSLQAWSHELDGEEEVWEALRSGEPVAIATSDAVSGDSESDADGLEDELPGWSAPSAVNSNSERLPRIVVELGLGDRAIRVEVIGVVEGLSGASLDFDGEDGDLPTLLMPESVASQLYPSPDYTRHYIATKSGADSLEVARGIERELRIFAVDIQGELQRQQQTTEAILALFQGFIGIGLVAGLAALGVIALRSVVERRQQIGVLRALGFQARSVGFELLLEMGFVALLGLGLGSALALGLAWRLFAEGTFGEIPMYIPLATILPMLIGAFVASLILTYFPARQAARTTIADALRYE